MPELYKDLNPLTREEVEDMEKKLAELQDALEDKLGNLKERPGFAVCPSCVTVIQNSLCAAPY